MAEIKLITKYDIKSPISEAYRSIRTNLQFAGAGKKMKTIGITSAIPMQGKSTTVSNLGVSIAQNNNHVLIIDGDMRKPMQHKLFGLPHKGLSNYIVTETDLETLIQKNVVDNLDVLSSGPIPPNPSELIGSDKMEKILQEVRDNYDYILIDLPPVLMVTDAVLISSKIDGILLCVVPNDISLEEGRQMKTKLIQGGANILGVILNKVPSQSHYYSYYTYYE